MCEIPCISYEWAQYEAGTLLQKLDLVSRPMYASTHGDDGNRVLFGETPPQPIFLDQKWLRKRSNAKVSPKGVLFRENGL